jgi:site-specific DNA-adenine methylase
MNFLDGDFIYVDPPYFPEKTNSFVRYSNDGFSLNDHIMLFKLCGGCCNIHEDILDNPHEDILDNPHEDILDNPHEDILGNPHEDILDNPHKNIKIIISNSNTEFVKKYFNNDLFTIVELELKRSIHSKDPSITASELFIIKK